jgi:pentatricopeptide repeat protein
MQSHIRAGHFPGAYSVLAAAEDSGIKLGPVLFTQLIVGLNDKGLFEKSWEVFNHMRVNHCEPDVVTFTSMINGRQQGGDLLCVGDLEVVVHSSVCSQRSQRVVDAIKWKKL